MKGSSAGSFQSKSAGAFKCKIHKQQSLTMNDIITDRGIDFLCLTETWHQPNEYLSSTSTLHLAMPTWTVLATSGQGGDWL